MRSDKGKNKTKLIIPLFIIVIMVLSVFGVMIGGLTSDQGAVKYKGFIFKQANNGFSFDSAGSQYVILNDPRNIEGFYQDYPKEFLIDLSNAKYSKIYVDISDDKAIAASGDVYSNLKGKLNMDVSCVPGKEDASRCSNLPIRGCSKEQDFVVVSFNTAQEKSVSYENSCLRINGSEGFLLGMADVFVMVHAGVFNE